MTTNRELIEYLKQYPPDAEVQVLDSGSWDDGERGGYDPRWKEIDPEEDIAYSDKDNVLTIGCW